MNSTPEPLRAPWTAEQVTALNTFQQRGGMHPFTCGGEHTPGSPALVAYVDGWRCPQPYGEACDYRQDWAHAFMADPGAWPAAAVSVAVPPTVERRDRYAALAEDLRYVLGYTGPRHAHEKPGFWDTSGKPCGHCARLAVAQRNLAAYDADPSAVLPVADAEQAALRTRVACLATALGEAVQHVGGSGGDLGLGTFERWRAVLAQPDDGQCGVAADAEKAELRERHKASLQRADEINNQLMEEVQRYAAGTERPVLWSVYNEMHKRAITAETRAEAMERATQSTAADALRHGGCHRKLMAQCQRAEKAEAAIQRVLAFAASLDEIGRNLAGPEAVHPVAEHIRHQLAEPADDPAAVVSQPDEEARWCKCPSCWGWFVEEHPGEDLDELGRDLSWWSGLPEHRDAPAGVQTVGHAPGTAVLCPGCRAKGHSVCLSGGSGGLTP